MFGRSDCAATPDTIGSDDELDEIDIDNFLDILAEVVMAIARRRQPLDQ